MLTSGTETSGAFAIGRLQSADQEAVLEIYRLGIETGQATFETAVPAWTEWDAVHHDSCRLVARRLEQVIGWAALSPVSRRQVYAGVAEVSIYIHPGFHRQGVGKTLMAALIACAEAAGFWMLQASVFPENAASLALLQKAGFRLVGRREKIARLHGVWRDTVLLERRSPALG